MPIEIQTFRNEQTEGSILSRSPAEIPDTGIRYGSDVWFEPGYIHRRGKAQSLWVNPAFSGRRPIGIFGMYRQDGTFRIGAFLTNATSTYFHYVSADRTTFSSIDSGMAGAYGLIGAYPIFDAKMGNQGNLLVGVAQSAHNATGSIARSLQMWRGAGKLGDPGTGANNITVTRGSATVTGVATSWLTTVEPGMFIHVDVSAGLWSYVGIVKSIESNTSLTLEQGCLAPTYTGTSWKILPFRGLGRRYAEGAITVSAGGTTINGGSTRFVDEALLPTAGNPWDFFRLNDMAYIGTSTATPASNTSITISAAAIGVTNERYVAIQRRHNYSNTNDVGIFTSTWNGYQFYANGGIRQPDGSWPINRIWYSDPDDLEAISRAKEGGSWFDIVSSRPNTPIQGIIATKNALLIFTEVETFALSGSSPDDWAIRRIHSDGTLSNMSVVPWEDGAMWVGRRGIYQYDGTEIVDITEERLGKFYHDAIANFNVETDRIWGTIYNGHYLAYVESFHPTYTPVMEGATDTINNTTIVVNLVTGAISFWQNVGLKGSLTLPTGEATEQVSLVHGYDGATHTTRFMDMAYLFKKDTVGVDQWASYLDWRTFGPFFYIESPRYDMGDPQIKKLFKQLQLFHKNPDITIQLDIIQGLGETATTALSTYPIAATHTNHRIKFLKRSQHLGFRIYQESQSNEIVSVGEWAIGFKKQRPGRV